MKKRIITLILLLGLVSPCFSQEALRARAHASDLSEAFEYVADKITPSLVNISSVVKVKHTRNLGRGGMRGHPNNSYNEFLEEFFKRFEQPGAPSNRVPQSRGQNRQRERKQKQGMGSGFIIDDKGYIVTNNHVVSGADEVEVTLHDKRTLKAEVIGTDPKTDIAVLKINASGLKPVILGDSESLGIGSWVVAAGNPFGLTNTITAGIVSAKGRTISGGEQYEDYIQTDAAINPGNSGGPLLDLNGRVIGINTAIFSRSGGYMGIGFAIPVNLARNVIDSLISDGKVRRGWLGVAIQDLDEDLSRSFDFNGKGVLIGDVNANSPAEKGGMQPGDIVTSLNGQRTESATDLRNIVAQIKPGSKIDVLLYRDGRQKKLKFSIGERKSDTKDSVKAPSQEDSFDDSLGLSLRDLTSEEKEALSTDGNVIVTSVDPYSPAGSAGLMKDDILIKVGKTNIDSLSQFKKLIDKGNLKRGIRIIVENAGMKRFVVLREE